MLQYSIGVISLEEYSLQHHSMSPPSPPEEVKVESETVMYDQPAEIAYRSLPLLVNSPNGIQSSFLSRLSHWQ